MTAMKHITGSLAPTNLEAITARTRDLIWDAAFNYSIGLIVKDIRDTATLVIDSHSTAFGGRSAALDFMDRFTSVLNEAGVAELEFTGSVLITVTSETEPAIFKLLVEKGVVTREEATLNWESLSE
jgi:hypothetical protein